MIISTMTMTMASIFQVRWPRHDSATLLLNDPASGPPTQPSHEGRGRLRDRVEVHSVRAPPGTGARPQRAAALRVPDRPPRHGEDPGADRQSPGPASSTGARARGEHVEGEPGSVVQHPVPSAKDSSGSGSGGRQASHPLPRI